MIGVLCLLIAAVDADARSVGELLAAAAAQVDGVEVSTLADLRDVVSLQGQKQAAGCDDNTDACMAEVASALGARFALVSELGSLGRERTLSLNLLDVDGAKTAARVVLRGRDIGALGQQIDDAVPRLLQAARGSRLVVLDTRNSGGAESATAAATEEATPAFPWLAVGGGSLAAVGAVVVGFAVAGDIGVAGLQQSLDQQGATRLDQPAAVAAYAERDELAGLTRIGYLVGGSVLVLGLGIAGAGLIGGGP